jgi:hypothetical protein
MQNRTPRHVPHGSCQARDNTRHPIPGLHTGLQASHRTFSQCSALSDGSVGSKDTPSHADTSSIRSYSLKKVHTTVSAKKNKKSVCAVSTGLIQFFGKRA